MTEKRKREIVTFKVDHPLWNVLRDIPNRSEFIRRAIQAALGGVCPLCQGAGTLSADQKGHWDRFSESHSLRKCDDCHAIHLVCLTQSDPDTPGADSQR
jgi:hypothetical protein